jgi:hypothetical protein
LSFPKTGWGVNLKYSLLALILCNHFVFARAEKVPIIINNEFFRFDDCGYRGKEPRLMVARNEAELKKIFSIVNDGLNYEFQYDKRYDLDFDKYFYVFSFSGLTPYASANFWIREFTREERQVNVKVEGEYTVSSKINPGEEEFSLFAIKRIKRAAFGGTNAQRLEEKTPIVARLEKSYTRAIYSTTPDKYKENENNFLVATTPEEAKKILPLLKSDSRAQEEIERADFNKNIYLFFHMGTCQSSDCRIEIEDVSRTGPVGNYDRVVSIGRFIQSVNPSRHTRSLWKGIAVSRDSIKGHSKGEPITGMTKYEMVRDETFLQTVFESKP